MAEARHPCPETVVKTTVSTTEMDNSEEISDGWLYGPREMLHGVQGRTGSPTGVPKSESFLKRQEFKERAKAQRKDKEKMKEKINQLEEELRILKTQIGPTKEIEFSHAPYVGKAVQIKLQVDALVNDFTDREQCHLKKIDDQKDLIRLKNETICDLQQELLNLKKELTVVEKKNQNEISELKNQHSELLNNFAKEKEGQIKDVHAKIKSMQKEYILDGCARSELTGIKRQNQQLSGQIERLSAEHGKLLSNNSELEKTKEDERRRFDEDRERWEKEKRELTEELWKMRMEKETPRYPLVTRQRRNLSKLSVYQQDGTDARKRKRQRNDD
ncbi:golgin subfamily A member 6-like protein 6 [Lingula anatina]|uniref:Golgin subfamily A member 6-like protein 6 n=1 Tax=Lingula anatina TaxID=7574 RepID=A0A1S3IPA4_LINAN|nr:golgin subfamily A member 6-like protein 6 [Lingula anatina]|eukprot:XP_013400042.1 golgin subfamily A member 6-like protein 6 [Lingula anatina]